MCHKIGCSPISTIGFGFKWLSSLILVPNPPANITTFMGVPSFILPCLCISGGSMALHRLP